jgi:hypothetical protein
LKTRFILTRRLFTRIGVAALLLTFLGAASRAQTVNSTVSGIVTDQTGAVVAGVKITLLDSAPNWVSTRRRTMKVATRLMMSEQVCTR